MTRLAIPVLASEGRDSKVSEHFARSEYFAIIVLKGKHIASVDVAHCVPDDDKKKAEFLAGLGVDIVLAGRIGSCMTRILIDRGVKIYSGAEGTVEEAVKAFASGKLAEVKPNPYQI